MRPARPIAAAPLTSPPWPEKPWQSLFDEQGLSGRIKPMLDKVAGACTNASEAKQLANGLLEARVDGQQARRIH